MAVVGPNGVNAGGEAVDHMVDELNARILVVAFVDLQGSDPRRTRSGMTHLFPIPG